LKRETLDLKKIQDILIGQLSHDKRNEREMEGLNRMNGRKKNNQLWDPYFHSSKTARSAQKGPND
jgi:hypothetical protein